MTTPHERDREDEALDALIVAAFRSDQGKEDDDLDLTGPVPRLSEGDERALAALGPDVVAKILADRREPAHGERRRPVQRLHVPEPELAGAMNRGEEDAELTEDAREEMERKVREHEEECGEEPSK